MEKKLDHNKKKSWALVLVKAFIIMIQDGFENIKLVGICFLNGLGQL